MSASVRVSAGHSRTYIRLPIAEAVRSLLLADPCRNASCSATAWCSTPFSQELCVEQHCTLLYLPVSIGAKRATSVDIPQAICLNRLSSLPLDSAISKHVILFSTAIFSKEGDSRRRLVSSNTVYRCKRLRGETRRLCSRMRSSQQMQTGCFERHGGIRLDSSRPAVQVLWSIRAAGIEVS